MILTLAIIIFKGTIQVGGIANLWQINYDGGRLNFFNLDPDPFIRQVEFYRKENYSLRFNFYIG